MNNGVVSNGTVSPNHARHSTRGTLVSELGDHELNRHSASRIIIYYDSRMKKCRPVVIKYAAGVVSRIEAPK